MNSKTRNGISMLDPKLLVMATSLDVVALLQEVAKIIFGGGQGGEETEEVLGAAREFPDSDVAVLVGSEDVVGEGKE